MPKRTSIDLSKWASYSGAGPMNAAKDPLEDDPNGLLVDAIAQKWPTVAMKEGK